MFSQFNVSIRFEEEIGIPNYVDGNPQSFGHMNHHLMNSASGYPAEHDSANSYIDNTMPGNYELKYLFNL